MRKVNRNTWIICCLLGMLLLLSGCYHRHGGKAQHAALIEYSDRQLDSISFSSTHHYTNKYNFVVSSDSLMLIRQQPEEYVNHLRIDSFAVRKHCLLVVSDIRIIPQDTEDSVWVQLATEENEFGWSHESRLLPRVVPDDPISQFILIFSNTHLLIFMIVIVLISVAYLLRKISHSNAHIVHFNDIDSAYPTALVLMVSLSAGVCLGDIDIGIGLSRRGKASSQSWRCHPVSGRSCRSLCSRLHHLQSLHTILCGLCPLGILLLVRHPPFPASMRRKERNKCRCDKTVCCR